MDIAEPLVAEGIGASAEPALPGVPAVLLVEPVDTGRTVVERHIGTGFADSHQGTGLGPQLGPWGLLVDCNKLRYIRVHRHPGMIQDKSDSL